MSIMLLEDFEEDYEEDYAASQLLVAKTGQF